MQVCKTVSIQKYYIIIIMQLYKKAEKERWREKHERNEDSGLTNIVDLDIHFIDIAIRTYVGCMKVGKVKESLFDKRMPALGMMSIV